MKVRVDQTVSDAVGARVRELRRRAGLSVDDVAERCAQAGSPDVTKNSLYFIEAGRRDKADGRRRRMVTVDELVALAKALEVTPLQLLADPGAVATPAGMRRYLVRMVSGQEFSWTGDPAAGMLVGGLLLLDGGTLLNVSQIESMTPAD